MMGRYNENACNFRFGFNWCECSKLALPLFLYIDFKDGSCSTMVSQIQIQLPSLHLILLNVALEWWEKLQNINTAKHSHLSIS